MQCCTVALRTHECSAGNAVRATQSQGSKACQSQVIQAAMTNVCCCVYRCTLALHTGDTKLETLCSIHNHKSAKTASHNLRKLNLQRVTLIHAAEDAHLASLTEKTKRNPQGQMLRRRGLAQVRNQLLFRSDLQSSASVKFFLNTSCVSLPCFCWCKGSSRPV